MPQAALSQLFRALGTAAGRVCNLRIASASVLPLDVEHRLIQGQPTRIEGEHPRTLYTVSIGEAMSCGDQSIDEGSEVPWHAHEASEEVLRCVAGTGTIYCGDVVKDFLPGVTVLVPKQTPHRIVNCSRSEKLWLSWTLSPPQSTKQFQAGENRVQAG